MKISQKLISFALVITMSMGVATLPAFASGNSDLFPYLQTSQGYYWYSYNGTQSTVTSGTKLGNLLGMLGGNVTQALSQLYSKVNSIAGYVDGIEGKLDTSNTHLNSIKGYVDGLEGYVNDLEGYVDGIESALTTANSKLSDIISSVDGLEGYVDGLETAFSTSNTRLSEIKTAIQNITTYNYTQVLNSIKSNTDYLSVIDTYVQSIQDSIGYGTSGDNVLSKLSAIVLTNSNIDSSSSGILTAITNYTANTSAKSRWRSNQYGNIIDTTSYNGFYNINGFAYPTLTTDSTSSGDQYRYKINTSSDITMLDGLENLSIIGNFTLSKLYTPNTRYTYMVYDPTTNTMVPYKNTSDVTISALSIMDILTHYGQYILEGTSKLQNMLADDDALAAKQANKPQEQNVLDNFTGSGSASASTSDFTGVKDSVSALKTSLSGGASYTQAFNILSGDSDGWSWFTNEVAESMDTTSNGNTRLRSISDSTPYLDAYYEQLSSYLGYSYNGGIE